jgi:phosphoribosylformimino-5-aminoimidazole carboxamide ribotide isomerase
MTRFRPCIDLRGGSVVQVVGGTLDRADASGDDATVTNFVAEQPAEWFADLYRSDGLHGGHVIQLGPGNERAARAALAAHPGGLQLGGGVTVESAVDWLDAGASHVIVTSWLFDSGVFQPARVDRLVAAIGHERLVLDLSCRPDADGRYVVMTDRWQMPTDLVLGAATVASLGERCAELLVHAVDVEGRQSGIDERLVELLAEWSPVPVTYAGGARSLDDLSLVADRSGGRVDLTIGSALDIFGGSGARYADCVAWNRARH